MQAIILAAGMGKRLGKLTKTNTKCMVEVNGVPLIDRMLGQLDRINLSKIIIVIGYEGEKLTNHIEKLSIKTPINYVNNAIYNKTNNIYSLSLAKEYLMKEDTLLLESDLIFEYSVLDALLEDPRDTLALVDKYESWMDGTCIKIGDADTIDAFVPGNKFVFEDCQLYYKTVNIYKFSKMFSQRYYVPFLEAYSKALGNNEYYEQVLRVITMLDNPVIKAKKLNGQLWYEIDDIQDLDIASSMFASDEDEKVCSIQSRYGGYWRYPHLLDFCHLVNPYFPPQKLIDEMKASFEKLITEYPSGMEVNSLLAAKNFWVNKEHILIGNGASELIKALMECISGKIGCIRPTFDEYPNRYDTSHTEIFVSQNNNFSYKVNDLIDFFAYKNISTLVLINPDNPSGNYIPTNELFKLLDWCEKRKIRVIVDESFADFADENNNSLINEEILNTYKCLVVIKSISESYGVPGIRLGILAASDEDLVNLLKKKVSIWNINSFGEFYMQIEEKYKKDYSEGLKKFKETRRSFADELRTIASLRVIPSQANYFMIEILNSTSAKELTKRLLLRYNILIKDLSEKCSSGQYIRVAIRNENDNMRLVKALRDAVNE